MLSRVAERTYWIGRYMERAENIARLCNVFGKLFLDLPSSTGLGWMEIVQINGAGALFRNQVQRPDERSAIEFLLIDQNNPGSLISSLAMARENARTTRDILPTEAWLAINRLFLETRECSAPLMTQTGRHRVLSEIVGDCQTFAGLMSGTMSHGDAYRFVLAGTNLERADMTSRTLDAAIALLLSNREELQAYDNTLWMAVLKSVSGYQMYRQSVRRRVTGKDAIRFLFTDTEFPRSIRFCINQVGATLKRLPRYDAVKEKMKSLSGNLGEQSFEAMPSAEMHSYIDSLQTEIAGVHDAITENWFQPDRTA